MMADNPFFSVIIPTKNRSHVVGNAIQSVLNQTFADFEILLVDNDDTDATCRVIERFDDHRIQYFRTGGYSMADNWDYGSHHIRGQFLTYLEDKQVLYARALQTIHHHINTKNGVQCVNWFVDSIDNTQSGTYRYSHLHARPSQPPKLIPAQEILKRFLNSGAPDSLHMPKGLNSCCHHSIVEQILNSPAGRFCLPTGPDVTMAFLQLAFVSDVLCIDESLSAIAWADSGNLSYTLKKDTTVINNFFRETGVENIYNKVPIKSHRIGNNFHYNDFLNMRDLVGGNLSLVEFDLARYFAACYRELVDRTKLGVDMSEEMTIWHTALIEQPATIQATITTQIADDKRHLMRHKLMSKIRSNPLFAIPRKFYRIMRPHKSADVDSTPVFRDIFTALEWEAHRDIS